MARQHNTNRYNGAWTEEEKLVVWKKGKSIPSYPDTQWRLDACGQVMQWSQYGNRNSDYGWEIDHINPVSNGGTDILSNLQPLNWKKNSAKGDNVNWRCGQ